MPKVSIITINKNNSSGLRRTLESVASQKKCDFEFIVIDGKSTDGSLDIIHEFSSSITFWRSEVDSGIYNAMNKGALIASGDFLLFLNSGDILFSSDTLFLISEQMIHYENSELISGDLHLVNSDGVNQFFRSPEYPDLSFILEKYLSHPSTLIKRSFFLINGGYDESFEIVGDYAFFYMAVQKARYSKVDLVISTHYLDGVSNSKANSLKHQLERLKAIEKYTPDIYLTTIHEYLRLKKYDSFISFVGYLGNLMRKFGFISKR